MKIVLILALAISIYAADTCYTVQLVSKYNSKKNIALLDKIDYPQNCKLMEIGKSLTVRCGCYEKYVKADETLADLKQEYGEAVIATTYKYRFDDMPKELKEESEPASISTIEETIKKSSLSFSELSNSRDNLNQETISTKKEIASLEEEIEEKNVISYDISEKLVSKKESLAGSGKDSKQLKRELKDAVDELSELQRIKDESSKYIDFRALNQDIEIAENRVKDLEAKSSTMDKKSLKSDISKLTILQKSLDKDIESLNLTLENKRNKSLENESELRSITAQMKQKEVVVAPVVQDEKVEELVLVEDSVSIEETPVVQSHKVKKSKKKKKSKNKFIKKRDERYVYTPYINMLRNDKGIGPFDYKYKFGAQISYDIGIVSEVDPLYSIGETHYTQNDWRRVRVTHKGSFFDKKLFYEMEYSFTGNNQYKDMFIGYTDKIDALNSRYRLKAGNIKIPFSLEAYTSSKYITFMERALSDAYADGRKMGGELLLSTKLDKNRINLFAAGFSNSIDERIDNDVEQPGYSLRGTYAYKFSKRHLISLGGAIMNQDMKGENVRFSLSSESKFAKNKYVSVKIKDVDMMKKSNIEALYINKKFSLQGEYTTVVTEALENDYTFDAYYLQGSYFLLGKGRRYKLSTSTLGKIRPNKDGALELAFRYSYIDLNDKDEHGGTQTDYNYALNWYYSPELKFMVNYVVAEPSGTDDYDGRLKILQARVLFAF